MLKKIKGFSSLKNSENSYSSVDQRKKELDKKLVYSLNKKKVPSFKQVKYLPSVLDKKQKKIIVLFLLLIVGSIFSLGITFYTRNFVTVPTEGGEFTTGLIGAPQYINPLLAQTNDVDSDIARLLFSGLLKYDKNLQLVTDMAAFWETSEDQKTYTFTLKEGLKWHDGEPVTADDIIFTFQSIQDPDFKSPLLISFRGVSIEKIDNLTVRFTLPEVYPSFLEVLTFGILPEHIWGEISPINANLTEYNLKPIGSGPWIFKTLQKDKLGNIKTFTIEPFKDYYGPKAYIQKITFRFYPDFESAVAALNNNSIEGISYLPKEFKADLTTEKNLNYYSFYLPQYTAIFFNQKKNEILKDKNIRKALALSIDKSKILTEALQLEGEIIDGPILPVNTTVPEDKKIGFDPSQAMLILKKDKWEKITPEEYTQFIKKQNTEKIKAKIKEDEKNQIATSTQQIDIKESSENLLIDQGQEFYRKKDNTILEVTLTTVNQPESTIAAQLIKESWEKIGFKVNLKIVEGSKISREIIKPRNYEILLFGIIVGSNPDPYPFWHSSQVQDPGLNLAQFANREADKLLEDARKLTDEDKQKEKYEKFLNILTTEIPAIFLHNPTYTYVANKKIKGIDIDRIINPADRFNNLENWFIKTKKQLKSGVY